MPNFDSPGVYTYEKDLTLRKGDFSRGYGVVVNNGGVVPYSPPVKKPIFWILRCGYWEDGGTWLDYDKWEDNIIC